MSNRTASFRQSDVTRAVKGFLACGLSVAAARIEKDGTIVILSTIEGASKSVTPNPDELL